MLALVTIDEQARCCPACRVRPEHPHGWVQTRPRDLPVAGRRTELTWTKRRWKCRTPDCPRRTFTESLPQIPPRSRLTCRLRQSAAGGSGRPRHPRGLGAPVRQGSARRRDSRLRGPGRSRQLHHPDGRRYPAPATRLGGSGMNREQLKGHLDLLLLISGATGPACSATYRYETGSQIALPIPCLSPHVNGAECLPHYVRRRAQQSLPDRTRCGTPLLYDWYDSSAGHPAEE
jgi:zinc-finger of transposase IS204/IS1001/IS1096/IS1165